MDATSTPSEHAFPDEEQRSGAMPIRWADVRSEVSSSEEPVNDFDHFGEPSVLLTLQGDDESDGSLHVAVAAGPIVALVDLRPSTPIPAAPAAQPTSVPAPVVPATGSPGVGRLVAWAVALGAGAGAVAELWSLAGR